MRQGVGEERLPRLNRPGLREAELVGPGGQIEDGGDRALDDLAGLCGLPPCQQQPFRRSLPGDGGEVRRLSLPIVIHLYQTNLLIRPACESDQPVNQIITDEEPLRAPLPRTVGSARGRGRPG